MGINLVKDAYEIAKYGYNLDVSPEIRQKLIQKRPDFIKVSPRDDLPVINKKGVFSGEYIRKYANYQTAEDEYVKYGYSGVQRLIYKNNKPFGAVTFSKNYGNNTFLAEVFQCGKHNEIFRIFQDGTRRLLIGLGKFTDYFDIKDFRVLVKETGANIIKFL